jgi:hypothetical protein
MGFKVSAKAGKGLVLTHGLDDDSREADTRFLLQSGAILVEGTAVV